MGNSHGGKLPVKLEGKAKIAAAKFDIDELHVLYQTWMDLADRSNGKGIDKDTFLQYFPLMGLLGERLFAQFDLKRTGYIDFEEFIVGLSLICRGSQNEKIQFIFNMYDVSKDNTVSRQELTTLLNQIPTDILHHTPRDTLQLSMHGNATGTDHDKHSMKGSHEVGTSPTESKREQRTAAPLRMWSIVAEKMHAPHVRDTVTALHPLFYSYLLSHSVSCGGCIVLSNSGLHDMASTSLTHSSDHLISSHLISSHPISSPYQQYPLFFPFSRR
jgi:Ca2+-binding EF-hand superfamily protein